MVCIELEKYSIVKRLPASPYKEASSRPIICHHPFILESPEFIVLFQRPGVIKCVMLHSIKVGFIIGSPNQIQSIAQDVSLYILVLHSEPSSREIIDK